MSEATWPNGEELLVGEPLKLEDWQFDFSGLVLDWQEVQANPPLCAVCGKAEDGEPEVPFIMWKDKHRYSLYFHTKCGFPRINLRGERGFAA